MRSRRLVPARVAAPLAALVLVAAGCGGGDKTPGVATIAGATTDPATTASSASAGVGTGNPGGAGGGMHMAMQVGSGAAGAKFAACMRSHGVPSFPDPSSSGVISIDSSSGIDPRSPKFQSAQQACRTLLPNGGQPSPAQIAKAQKAALAFSACMRAHGIKDFPDPNFSGGRISVQIKGGKGSNLDPNSPTFQAAQKACQGNLPFKGGPGPSTSSSSGK